MRFLAAAATTDKRSSVRAITTKKNKNDNNKRSSALVLSARFEGVSRRTAQRRQRRVAGDRLTYKLAAASVSCVGG